MPTLDESIVIPVPREEVYDYMWSSTTSPPEEGEFP